MENITDTIISTNIKWNNIKFIILTTVCNQKTFYSMAIFSFCKNLLAILPLPLLEHVFKKALQNCQNTLWNYIYKKIWLSFSNANLNRPNAKRDSCTPNSLEGNHLKRCGSENTLCNLRIFFEPNKLPQSCSLANYNLVQFS